jgi:hypothetical protein
VSVESLSGAYCNKLRSNDVAPDRPRSCNVPQGRGTPRPQSHSTAHAFSVRIASTGDVPRFAGHDDVAPDRPRSCNDPQVRVPRFAGHDDLARRPQHLARIFGTHCIYGRRPPPSRAMTTSPANPTPRPQSHPPITPRTSHRRRLIHRLGYSRYTVLPTLPAPASSRHPR